MKKNLFIGLVIAMIVVACSAAPATAPDPNVSLMIAQAQLTSTSQALEIQIIGWTATAQSWTPTPSSTPIPTWTPSITPTPTLNATGTLVAEKMQAEIDEMNRKSERENMTNTFWAIITPLLVLVSLVLVVFGVAYSAITISRTIRKKPLYRDEKGDAPLVYDIVKGDVIDSDRNPNFSTGELTARDVLWNLFQQYMEKKHGYQPVHPQNTPGRQDEATKRDQVTDMQSRTKVTNAALKKLMESNGLDKFDFHKNPSDPAPATPAIDNLFALPSWDLVKGWNRDKDMLPLGNSSNGLEYWSLRIQAHLAIFGMTRSGKDFRLLRPLVAFMLASGQRVVMIGKEIDFLPFIGHPNLVFVPVYDVTDREEALKYTAALAACVDEKNNRIKHMTMSGYSLWQDERTFVVLGELGNGIIEMPSDLAEFAMRKTRSIVNEGGKAGLNFVFSTQRPKGFVDLTTQCGRAVFQVESNMERGYALGINIKDAERLPDIPTGYFYKKFRTLQVTGGFEPSDDEIRRYLGTYTVKALPKADWIDAVSTPRIDQPKAEVISLPGETTIQENPKNDDEERIIELHRQGKKPSVIIREIWGITGGGRYSEKSDLVKSILEKKDFSSSSEPETPKNGLFGTV